MDGITTLMSVAFIFKFNCTLMAVRQSTKVIFKSFRRSFTLRTRKNTEKLINTKELIVNLVIGYLLGFWDFSNLA